MVSIFKISSEKFVHNFIHCNQVINVNQGSSIISEVALLPSRVLHFPSFPCEKSQQHYLSFSEFMNSGFIRAYAFLVNVLTNRIFFLIRKKELKRFDY